MTQIQTRTIELIRTEAGSTVAVPNRVTGQVTQVPLGDRSYLHQQSDHQTQPRSLEYNGGNR